MRMILPSAQGSNRRGWTIAASWRTVRRSMTARLRHLDASQLPASAGTTAFGTATATAKKPNHKRD
jgi:hypothetical protein